MYYCSCGKKTTKGAEKEMNKEKTIKILKKIWDLDIVEDQTIIPEAERKMYTDRANVMGIIPKTYEAKKLITDFFNVSLFENSKIPDLDYHDDSNNQIQCKYSQEYIKIILELIKYSDTEKIIFKLKPDYPLWVETNEFIIILAPMVD
jgi:hypothetical protein